MERTLTIKPINWNEIPDQTDKIVWDRLTANFWLPEKVPVANDIDTWRKMTPVEKELVRKVFATLTYYDTVQGVEGAPSLLRVADTPHAEAVFTNIAFMESVHAKSYSTIFSTLCSTDEINELFKWAEDDNLLNQHIDQLTEAYAGGHIRAFVTSVFLESMLFYTGFYTPLRFASQGRLTNTADIIRLILRDEGVHGYYIGYKAQKMKEDIDLTDEAYANLVYDVCQKFYEVELKRVEQMYDDIGWSEDVKNFLRYNANKALANLGVASMFSPAQTEIPAYILAALDPGTGETHDFFSGSGASYVIGKAEETEDEDWEWD